MVAPVNQLIRILGLALLVCLGLKIVAAMVTPFLPLVVVLLILAVIWYYFFGRNGRL